MSDITIAGATFSDVTKIQIPKSGSGTAEFLEVSGSQEITENNTYDVSALAQVVVNVAGGGGGGGWETESGTWTPAADTEHYTDGIPYSNPHSSRPDLILMVDATGTALPTQSPAYAAFINFETLLGSKFPFSGSTLRSIGFVDYAATSSSTSTTYGGKGVNDSTGSTVLYASFFTSNSKFFPYTFANGASLSFRAGRTYKWLALWKPQS